MEQLQIEAIINELYANNAFKLRKMCNKEMMRFGGIFPKDFDDFYSRVGYEISLVKKKYENESCPFDRKTFMDYIAGVVKLSIWKEMTYKNRSKRQMVIKNEEKDENGNVVITKVFVPNLSLDAPISDEDDSTLSDLIASNVDIEKEILESDEDVVGNKKIERYLNSLSKIQRKIIEMKMMDIEVQNIKKELNLTDRQYADYMQEAIQYEHIRLLHIQ